MVNINVVKGISIASILVAALAAPSAAEAGYAEHARTDLADAPSGATANAAGTWTWYFKAHGAQKGHTITMKMTVEGEKVAGVLSFPANGKTETRQVQGSLKGGDIEIRYEHEQSGIVHPFRYVGKVNGDAMSGRVYYLHNGETMNGAWEAKRTK